MSSNNRFTYPLDGGDCEGAELGEDALGPVGMDEDALFGEELDAAGDAEGPDDSGGLDGLEAEDGAEGVAEAEDTAGAEVGGAETEGVDAGAGVEDASVGVALDGEDELTADGEVAEV